MATTQTLEQNYQLRHHKAAADSPNVETRELLFRVHEADYEALVPHRGDQSYQFPDFVVTSVRRSQRAGAVWCTMYVTYVKRDTYTT